MNEGKIQLYKIFRAMLLAAAVAVFASALFFTCFSPVKVYAETTSGEESEEPQLYDYRVEDLKIDIVINEKSSAVGPLKSKKIRQKQAGRS